MEVIFQNVRFQPILFFSSAVLGYELQSVDFIKGNTKTDLVTKFPDFLNLM